MIKIASPMSGKVLPTKLPTPKKPTSPISGKVLPKKPQTKPQLPKTPVSGKVIPNKMTPVKKVAIGAALAIAAVGLGKVILDKIKKNSENKNS